MPHLPLWRRDLLPGHGGQHRATCPGGALHQGSAAEVSLSKHEGDVYISMDRYNGSWRGGLFHGRGVWNEGGHTYTGGFLYGKVMH